MSSCDRTPPAPLWCSLPFLKLFCENSEIFPRWFVVLAASCCQSAQSTWNVVSDFSQSTPRTKIIMNNWNKNFSNCNAKKVSHIFELFYQQFKILKLALVLLYLPLLEVVHILSAHVTEIGWHGLKNRTNGNSLLWSLLLSAIIVVLFCFVAVVVRYQ